MPKPKISVGIVGVGASGVTTYIQLVNKYISAQYHVPIEIFLFERSNHYGPGLAYGTPFDGHLLNTKAELMGIIPGQRDHFVKWMEQHRETIQESYPNLAIGPGSYPPRKLYGTYLQEALARAQDLAQANGVKTTRIEAAVSDIESDQNALKIHTASGQYSCDFVVLATGNPEPSAFKHFKSHSHFFASPWSDGIVSQIPTQAKVGIIGSSLTAIDAVITLIDNDHKGPITLLSITGLLPRVQSPEEVSIERQYLTLDALKELSKNGARPLQVKTLLRLFQKEYEQLNGTKNGWSMKERLGQAPLDLLAEDILLAQEGRNLHQNILYSLREEAYEIWQLLDASQQTLFLKWIKDYYDINRNPIPLQNADRLVGLLKTGQLQVIGQSKDIEAHQDQFTLIGAHDQEKVDFLINASGPAPQVSEMEDQPLWKRLLEKEYIADYPAGGIDIELHTLRVKNKFEQNTLAIYALGHPLSGIQHEVNSLWFNVEQADILTSQLLETMVNGHH